MSEVDRLKEEIKYFSGLIQKHKKQSTSTNKTRSHIASKYKWSKTLKPTSSYPTVYQNTSNNHALQSRKRSNPEVINVTRTKFSKHNVTQAPVTFDPKFKWSKGVQASTQPSIISHSSSSRATFSNVPFSTNTSTTAKSPVSAASTKNSKYKYHRSVPPDVKSSASPSLSDPHYSGYPVHKSVVSHKVKESFPTYKFKVKRPSPHKSVSPGTRNDPYKFHRKEEVSYTPYGKKAMSKVYGTRSARKISPLEKRKRSFDNSTHITLSKAALEALLKKHSVTLKQSLANKAVVKSHETNRTKRRSLDKSQQHCLYYGRFGKCMRGDSCKFIHDPAKIAVCTRFLRGTCRDANCSFSHKVEKEKVPLCMFFIRGKCTVPDCPYLHVFLGKHASVCKRFASTGFCPNADKCKEQHIKCCPEFYETGKCQKGTSCNLPHFKMKKAGMKKAHTPKETRREDVNVPGPSIKLASQPADSESSEEFLSLEVDAPAPINVPIRREPTLVKPRFVKLKSRNLPSQ